MGKREKEHRKKVQKRNLKIEQARKAFSVKFKDELLKEIEAEKLRRAAEMGEAIGEISPTPDERGGLS
jgi:DUF971 family protein